MRNGIFDVVDEALKHVEGGTAVALVQWRPGLVELNGQRIGLALVQSTPGLEAFNLRGQIRVYPVAANPRKRTDEPVVVDVGTLVIGRIVHLKSRIIVEETQRQPIPDLHQHQGNDAAQLIEGIGPIRTEY